MPTGPMCLPDQPVACAHRMRAVGAGRFTFNFTKRGWYWLDSVNPFRAWATCPWCGGTLASAEEVERRVNGVLSVIRQGDGHSFDDRDTQEEPDDAA